jgi:NhaA family Na+:H+ antiporter
LVARFTRASLDGDLGWVDVAGVAVQAGIGFTVSLLIGDLAYGPGTARGEHVKVGVLVRSFLAAVIAAVILRLRNRTYWRLCEAEELDTDRDGTPDFYEADANQSTAT